MLGFQAPSHSLEYHPRGSGNAARTRGVLNRGDGACLMVPRKGTQCVNSGSGVPAVDQGGVVAGQVDLDVRVAFTKIGVRLVGTAKGETPG